MIITPDAFLSFRSLPDFTTFQPFGNCGHSGMPTTLPPDAPRRIVMAPLRVTNASGSSSSSVAPERSITMRAFSAVPRAGTDPVASEMSGETTSR